MTPSTPRERAKMALLADLVTMCRLHDCDLCMADIIDTARDLPSALEQEMAA